MCHIQTLPINTTEKHQPMGAGYKNTTAITQQQTHKHGQEEGILNPNNRYPRTQTKDD